MSKKAVSHQSVKSDAKKNLLPILCIIVVVIAAASVLLPSLLKKESAGSSAAAAAGNDVVISADELSGTAHFYDYKAKDTTVQLFALKDSDGAIRMALNTCQVCNGSPYAYFVQEGDDFICQNCGNHFATSRIGIEVGGCNPIPITADVYEIRDGRIIISHEFLDENAALFTNWKKF